MSTEEFQRKLSAILSADVQGYSRLMGEDEDSTVRTLKAYRELMSSLIERYHGRVVDSPGDNLLSEFESVRDAVRCAFEIQEELRIRNEELPENSRMRFRIGINLGDVIKDGDRIYGDGINVAARVEGLAEGGGISISGTVYDSIKNKLAMHYDFQGEHSVKNIKDPVRVYRIRIEPDAAAPMVKEKGSKARAWQKVAFPVLAILILGVVAVWYFSFSQAPIDTEIINPIAEHATTAPEVKEAPKTIAVLPFDDLSPEKDQEYFVLGLSEEILNSLCQIPGLGVTGKTSSFSFQGTKKTIQEIASDLGVDHILEGSVRKAGTALRITAQLIRASDGLHLWSETYDRELKDIFEIQEDIANSVADKLKLTLEAFTLVGGTDNVEAYELYLVALGQWGKADYEVVSETIEEALALDPNFTLILAFKTNLLSSYSMDIPYGLVADELDAANRAAQRAFELEPNLAEANIALAHTKTVRHEWVDAEPIYRKAIELKTKQTSEDIGIDAIGSLYTHYYAVGNVRKALEYGYNAALLINPIKPSNLAGYIQLLTINGDMRQAEIQDERCRALFGDEWNSYNWENRFILGDSVSSDEITWSDLISDVAKKNFDYPEKVLSELRRLYTDDTNLSSINFRVISMWAAYFGDFELAMDAMEKAVSLQGVNALVIWFPVMHEVRQLPRFKEFVREIGLVDYWEQFGWPDICQPTGDGDFVCD